jgi:hypothetical protein
MFRLNRNKQKTNRNIDIDIVIDIDIDNLFPKHTYNAKSGSIVNYKYNKNEDYISKQAKTSSVGRPYSIKLFTIADLISTVGQL